MLLPFQFMISLNAYPFILYVKPSMISSNAYLSLFGKVIMISSNAYLSLFVKAIMMSSNTYLCMFFYKLQYVYRWVPLKPDFLGAWKSVRLKHYPAYPVIIISLITQRNLATKIRAKRESGLTAVRLKRDPPVLLKSSKCDTFIL